MREGGKEGGREGSGGLVNVSAVSPGPEYKQVQQYECVPEET